MRVAVTTERLGEIVGSDELIRLGLDALLAGVDSPSLRLLAGLGRAEEPEAHDLFARVVVELDLAPRMADHPTRLRWDLVRWWCQLIVDERLPFEMCCRLICNQGWSELGRPLALQPLVGWFSEWEDWNEHYSVPREFYREQIIAEARQLLAGPWPPVRSQ
jgi:hypothetical protein